MDLLPRGESACYRCPSGRWIGDFEPFTVARLGLPGGRGSRLGEQRVDRWIGLPERKGAAKT